MSRPILERVVARAVDPATGQMVVREVGRDCDCVDYEHEHVIAGTVAALDALRESIAASADGWFNLYPVPHAVSKAGVA